MKGIGGRLFARVMLIGTMVFTLMGIGAVSFAQMSPTAYAAKSTKTTCDLEAPGGTIKHVINVVFDNVHLTRDNPNVPSDLEQMPNLLNFLKNNGTVLANNHTPLIAHTADDILTGLTGVYGDRHGQSVANSYRYFNPDGTTQPAGSFAYWTSPVDAFATSTPTDTTYTVLDAQGKNAPAPWVSYTRAGCNFGSVAAANTILENIGVDVPTVFGANSPEVAEVKANPNKATADFVGIGIHCAKGSSVCANGQADRLPQEPGGYAGYNALFGHKFVAPKISPNGPLKDLNGNVIQDDNGNIGFPGFDAMTPAVSLSYVAAMQEHGVPITYAYLSDAHDNHATGTAFGPGSAGYVAALKSYDSAFGKFFTRLAEDGINKNNSLFVFTADEGDHFVGGAPTPANCNGVTTPCSYSQIGEINVNTTGLLATQQHITTPFTVHADSAPNFYLTGNPAQDATVTRTFERGVAALTATNPLTGKKDTLTNYLADQTEMKLLHMVTADPARTPTFTMFAKPDYYLYAGAPNCNTTCVAEEAAYAWNHGDVSPDINTTWLGIVGPGVQHLGINQSIWADHTDTRPTIMELLGLKDDYQHDGRVLFELLTRKALPDKVRDHLSYYENIARIYKQINAPVGVLGLTSLAISTQALESNAPGDSTYVQLENLLRGITVQRNAIAGRMISILENAEFGGHGDSDGGASVQGQALLGHAQALLRR
ncbi:MAG: hypothetical protein JO215_11065 [Ktedonobacteraceae bacterium]|nr:hypothetical protein [Ktedonobacteraceae bacterium]